MLKILYIPATPVTWVAVHSKAAVMLLLIYCLCISHCLWGFCVGCSFGMHYALLYVLSSFAIILTRKRELVALLLLSFGCLVTVNVL